MEKLCTFFGVLLLTLISPIFASHFGLVNGLISTAYAREDRYIISDSTKRAAVTKQWEVLWKFGITNEVESPVADDKAILGWLPRGNTPELQPLKRGNGISEFKLVAIGGSLPSGVRNGGLYREGQLTAYPNLIARQMGVNFNQPLFSVAEGNGSGYMVLQSVEGGVYQYNLVTNNLAFDNNVQTLSKSVGSFDNLAMPFLNIRYPWKTMDYFVQRGSRFDEESTDFVKYLQRVLPESSFNDPKLTYLSYLRSQPIPDFTIYDLGMDGHLKEAMIGGYTSQLPIASEDERGGRMEFLFLKEQAKSGGKGVVVTIPDVLDFPYFKIYSLDKFRHYSETAEVAVQQNNGIIRAANSSDIFLPTQNVVNLFREKKNTVLTETDVIAISEDLDESQPFHLVNWYNDYYVKYTAKENGWAVFDLFDLYKRISSGGFVTDDGVSVDPSFPNGNFYSSDGIHPTAFGQAVIANECISAINAHYGTKIEKLPTKGFLAQTK